jgi:hypothetical protein
MSDLVGMQLDVGQIILRPAPPAAKVPRQGWFDAVDLAAEQALSAELADWDAVGTGEITSDWAAEGFAVGAASLSGAAASPTL